MSLAEIIARSMPPVSTEGEGKIPWNDPEFSARMLVNHLAQDHDWASRRKDIIDSQLRYIVEHLPQSLKSPGAVCDLGCGPGLYTQVLAHAGYDCTGVDFSPASIAYAREQAIRQELNIAYIFADIRSCMTAYTEEQYRMMFAECGFARTTTIPREQWPVGTCFEGKLTACLCELANS